MGTTPARHDVTIGAVTINGKFLGWDAAAVKALLTDAGVLDPASDLTVERIPAGVLGGKVHTGRLAQFAAVLAARSLLINRGAAPADLGGLHVITAADGVPVFVSVDYTVDFSDETSQPRPATVTVEGDTATYRSWL